MSDNVRWDLINQLPDDMPVHEIDQVPLSLEVWRDALGHPYAEGHGFCKTCGAGGACILMAFYDAVQVSTVRELDKLGLLPPVKET